MRPGGRRCWRNRRRPPKRWRNRRCQRPDAARLEEVLGERGPGGVNRHRSEVGQENRRRFAGPVRRVAQRLERRARQPLARGERRRRRRSQPTADRWGVGLVDVGELADPGERIFALGQIGQLRPPRFVDLRRLPSRCPAPPPCRPGPRPPGSGARPPPRAPRCGVRRTTSRRRGRSPAPTGTPPAGSTACCGPGAARPRRARQGPSRREAR